uniref:Uncharacterized protein n=1 Tax=Candidatus Kentrum sp. LPFa TaxID=2126335 RepID=A0A450XBU3_9GAMM|nr:MAG: hypothetical protein BECKLPF1236A_GA0070988_1004122 [Candidatus Kentron sp. LPFa]VFK26763.1 MAG: hypothetical protein BECKLPF1236C_GA0070990_1003824 [Candidatus Kentron sp. LPFa]
MATKSGSGYVSKYFVDLWTSPSDRPSPFGTCGQPGQTTLRVAPPPDHTLRPLAHRVHKGYNNQIIYLFCYPENLRQNDQEISRNISYWIPAFAGMTGE